MFRTLIIGGGITLGAMCLFSSNVQANFTLEISADDATELDNQSGWIMGDSAIEDIYYNDATYTEPVAFTFDLEYEDGEYFHLDEYEEGEDDDNEVNFIDVDIELDARANVSVDTFISFQHYDNDCDTVILLPFERDNKVTKKFSLDTDSLLDAESSVQFSAILKVYDWRRLLLNNEDLKANVDYHNWVVMWDREEGVRARARLFLDDGDPLPPIYNLDPVVVVRSDDLGHLMNPTILDNTNLEKEYKYTQPDIRVYSKVYEFQHWQGVSYEDGIYCDFESAYSEVLSTWGLDDDMWAHCSTELSLEDPRVEKMWQISLWNVPLAFIPDHLIYTAP